MIPSAALLDSWRGGILRRTLRLGLARRIFVDRALRTPLWFSVSLGLNVLLVWQFPEFSFYAVPLILGVPHLLASFRYGWGESRAWSLYAGITLVFGCVLAMGAPAAWALVAIAVTLLGMLRRGMKLRWISASGVLGMIGYGFHADPYKTALSLAVLHNFVAFFFWFRSIRSSSERRGAMFALGMTGVACAMIPFLPTTASLGEISWNLAGLQADRFGVAFVRIFLLTQSLHYFIWLKAIPDQHAPTQVPKSFRSGFREDRLWFGPFVHAMVLILVVGFLVWALGVDRESARRAYVYLAAYHGFAELAFLAGIPGRSRG